MDFECFLFKFIFDFPQLVEVIIVKIIIAHVLFVCLVHKAVGSRQPRLRILTRRERIVIAHTALTLKISDTDDVTLASERVVLLILRLLLLAELNAVLADHRGTAALRRL